MDIVEFWFTSLVMFLPIDLALVIYTFFAIVGQFVNDSLTTFVVTYY